MKKITIKIILRLLDEKYPKDIKCYLNYNTPLQLLIATILSAQCTDNRVNIVTVELFNKYKDVSDFANADIGELESYIKTTGFYRNKAKNIIKCCQRILNDFNGVVPSDINELIKLNGVGRKTANVIRGNIFNIPSIVVDTHVKRVSYRLNLTNNTDPKKIEFDLMELLPKEHWIRYNTQIIAHGRSICTARNPKCSNCFLLPYCKTGLQTLLNKL